MKSYCVYFLRATATCGNTFHGNPSQNIHITALNIPPTLTYTMLSFSRSLYRAAHGTHVTNMLHSQLDGCSSVVLQVHFTRMLNKFRTETFESEISVWV